MKYSELDVSHRADLTQQLADGVRYASELTVDVGRETERYLLLINSGAAVALLTFMGTSNLIRETTAAWWALGLYAVGITAVGVFLGTNFHVTRATMLSLAKDRQQLYEDELTLSEFVKRRPAINTPVLPVVFGYIAFICFIAGSLTAGIGLYPLVARASGEGVTVTASGGAGSASVSPN